MKIKTLLTLLIAIILLMGLLTACGSETDVPDASAPDASVPDASAPTVDENSPTAEVPADAGNSSSAGGMVSDMGFRPEQNGFIFHTIMY